MQTLPFVSMSTDNPTFWRSILRSDECAGEVENMLWTIFVVLLVLWLVGLVSFHAIGAYIHILLVLALIVLLFQLFGGRRTAV
jgi:hypothetical protein